MNTYHALVAWGLAPMVLSYMALFIDKARAVAYALVALGTAIFGAAALVLAHHGHPSARAFAVAFALVTILLLLCVCLQVKDSVVSAFRQLRKGMARRRGTGHASQSEDGCQAEADDYAEVKE